MEWFHSAVLLLLMPVHAGPRTGRDIIDFCLILGNNYSFSRWVLDWQEARGQRLGEQEEAGRSPDLSAACFTLSLPLDRTMPASVSTVIDLDKKNPLDPNDYFSRKTSLTFRCSALGWRWQAWRRGLQRWVADWTPRTDGTPFGRPEPWQQEVTS